MGERTGTAPHSEDCDSLDCPCYRNGQDDLLVCLRTLRKMGLTDAYERLLTMDANGRRPDDG